MAKGKSGKTFFEVYGSQPPESHSASTSKADKEKIPVDFPYYEGENIIVVSDIADRLKTSKTKAEGPGKGRAAIIIAAIVCGVGLAVGMFFLGRSIGVDKVTPTVGMAAPKVQEKPATATGTKGGPSGGPERPEMTAPAPRKPIVEKPVPVAPPPAAPPESKDTWALRIVSYSDVQKNLERAAAVADFLQNATGQDAFVARLGNKLVVCLGEFDSKDDPRLLELQKQVREIEYENKKQFISNYPVRIK
ncbi:MAG TPA: hypothetical protein ACFYD2_01555 [Candidatus Avalokitesvara rifleensis]|uniref:hypothetical protein n=1 Tax=Candidatus Avalokitesvara rifleensis TaxID=3367620 RepID=UPI0027134D56|nr:hypothetical protein [Candidatus Brocadiales bacterium]